MTGWLDGRIRASSDPEENDYTLHTDQACCLHVSFCQQYTGTYMDRLCLAESVQL